ncbi:glycosyltransferase [Lentzea sp. NBRC 102530]|uniref:glycosyltransferase n=1 Tax=Lentzea sp. NBRC 102530 TaxID=3032201 RepID=UPI0025527508|nr:glycosyltransferase [Lentzea sp. NBRC 102530]
MPERSPAHVLKIALVDLPTRSSEQRAHVTELAVALSRHSHEPTVFRHKSDPAAPERVIAREGYEVVFVPTGTPQPRDDDAERHLGEIAEFLAGRWRSSPPDVVHSHGKLAGLAAVTSVDRTRTPVVHSGHGDDSPEPLRSGDAARLLAREVARFVTTSAAEVPELTRTGVHRARISIVPGGVDLDLFHPDGAVARKRHARRIVTVANAESSRGVAELVSVLPLLDDTEVVVVGAGAEARELRSFARHAGVAQRVVLAGRVPRSARPALLRSADVVVCLPETAPFGRIALEAMACGTPVVATEVGVLADAVVRGVSGLHVPAGNPRALTRTLTRLLDEVSAREQLGIAARDRATARYSRDRLARELTSVYARVADVPVAVSPQAVS